MTEDETPDSISSNFRMFFWDSLIMLVSSEGLLVSHSSRSWISRFDSFFPKAALVFDHRMRILHWVLVGEFSMQMDAGHLVHISESDGKITPDMALSREDLPE